MKFPPISRLYKEFKNVITAYPFEVFSAFCGSCAATALIEFEQNNAIASNWCIRIMMAANIGLLLSLSVTLFSRSRNLNPSKKLVLSIATLIVSGLFIYIFNPEKRESDYIRFFLVAFALHLLVAFTAFTNGTKINAFWQFNKNLFLRILSSVLYSGVLYLGLAAAVGATNFLFNFNFEWDTFAVMAVWIIGMFQTMFFLSGIPLLANLDEDHSYPKGLKLFTQYVLIPLATVYVSILLCYEIKILTQWNMPKGLVSSLILGYAVFGILSFLLIYPLRNQEDQKWIKTYSKSFFYLMIPLLVLLYLAIFVRVEKYGITEARYFLLSLALWLSFVTLYFISSVRQNIIIIPLSLSLITILAVYGPLSVFNIAEQSQLNRLEDLLGKNKLLPNGKLVVFVSEVDSSDTEEIAASARYLVDKYGIESLQPLIKENLTELTDSIKSSLQKKHKGRGTYIKWDLKEAERNWLTKQYKLPLDYSNKFFAAQVKEVEAQNKDLIPLYDSEFMINISFFQNTNDKIMLPSNTQLQYHFKDSGLILKIANDSLRVNILSVIKRIEENKSGLKQPDSIDSNNDLNSSTITLSRKKLTENFVLQGHKIALLINSMRYSNSGKTYDIQSINGVLLFKKVTL